MIPLFLDTETALIRPGFQAPELACVSVQSRGLGVRHLFHHSDYNEWVSAALADPEILIVGHSIAYDMIVLAADDPSLIPLIFAAYRANRITCTETRAKLLDIASGTMRFHEGDEEEDKAKKTKYSLESLSLRFLNRQLDKNTWRLKYGDLRPLPLAQWPEGARRYPLDDTGATEDLYQVQDTDQNQVFLQDQFRQARAAFWIKLMAAWGIRTDPQGIWELAEQTKQEYDGIAADLRGLGLLREDRTVKRRATGLIETVRGSRDTKAAKTRLIQAYAAMGKDYPRTEKGEPCLDKQACGDSEDPILIQYAHFTSLGTVLSKDIPALERGITQPLHSRFDPLKETGRTGSADPNIQNLRRLPGIRECFVPRCLSCGRVHTAEDVKFTACLNCGASLTVYIDSDYGGLELATQAQMCMTILQGRSALAVALNNDIDPHLMIAAQLLGRPYDELKRIKKAGAQKDCIAGQPRVVCACAYCQVDNARQTGKVVNFGFPGGLGAKTLVFFALTQYGVRLTEDEAKRLKRLWLSTWPEFAEYFKFIDWHTKQNPPRIKQLFSGRYRCGSYPELCNTVFQGLGADVAKEAGWEIACGQYVPGYNPALWGSRTVNFVHDNFLIEIPEFRAHEGAMSLGKVMVDAAKPWLPDVKIACEPLVTRRMSRKAKPIWRDGRLIPWDGRALAA